MAKLAKTASSVPLRGVPSRPAHLKLVAKKHFRRLSRLLDEAGILSRLDSDLLSQYSNLYARWRNAEDHLILEEDVITNNNGCVQKNPYYNISIECTRQMERFMSQMGLSPAARAKLKMAEQEEESPFDLFDEE
jgi:P27 family predicted phage terminase small subunit